MLAHPVLPQHTELPLVGRRSELRAIRSAIEACRRGSGSAVLVEGAAGLGKTRLLGEAMNTASDLGVRTLSATAEELEQGRPLGAFVRALHVTPDADDPTRAALAHDLASLQVLRGSVLDAIPGSHWQVADRVVELIEIFAGTDPVLVAVDDLHLADPLSLAALLALSRRLERMPVCLLAAFRPAPLARGVDRLIESLGRAGAHHLVLTELDEHDAQQLLTAGLGETPGADIVHLSHAAAGNPFYLLEVAAVGREDSPDRSEPLPARLRDAVLRHLRNMSDDEVGVLRTAAVLGSPFAVSDLCAVSRIGPLSSVR